MKKNSIIQDAKKLYKYNEDTNKGVYLERHSFQGWHGIYHYYLLGARGRGKSVSTMDEVIWAKEKYGYENVKCYYFRVSDLSTKALVANNAKDSVDGVLRSRWSMDITKKSNVVYNHGKPLFEAYSLVSAAKTGKGIALYDASFLNQRPINPKTGKPIKRFIYIIVDEFILAEGIEKKSIGDPYSQWLTFRETILRDQEKLDYDAVKIFYCANSVGDASTWLGRHLNFLPEPGKFGKYKFPLKHAVIFYDQPSKKYLEKRKNSMMGSDIDCENDSNYTNIADCDRDSLKKKNVRISRVTMLIKFSTKPADWFCLYDNKYIRKYQGETVRKTLMLAMVRNIDEVFLPDVVKALWEAYELREFLYCDLTTQASFKSHMKLLKVK